MKRLWALPLAAVVCGRPVDPPRLLPTIPAFEKDSCEEQSRRQFLLAYAYRAESKSLAQAHLRKAEEWLRSCENAALRARISALQNSTL